MTAPDPTPAARMSNSAITLITPLEGRGPLLLRPQFVLTRWFPQLKGLEAFRSVFFSSWSIVTGFPFNGAPQVKEEPSEPWLLWEVAYSAEVDPYIESFVRGIPSNIDRLWGTSYAFPGTGSVAELSRYIAALSWDIGHLYWAYPQGSVRTILASLEIAKEHAYLVEVARTGTAEEFARVYDGFLRRRGDQL